LDLISEVKGKAKIIRKQHCMNCNTVLALEISDKLGFRSHSEYWSIVKGLMMKGRWYGNEVTCPACGMTGKLPMDKPLAYESIQNKDVEMEKRIHEKIKEGKEKSDESKTEN
jgi:hypothetical protein